MKKLMAVLVSVVLLCSAVLPALAEPSVKDETVYVLAEPDGAARRIIVSDWLSNPDGEAKLADASTLGEIVNVKGEQTFDGSVWLADGADIYYQGESAETLPVAMKITYTLDGQEITPEELAGRDGHVVIRFDYDVAQTSDIQVNGQTKTLTVPYVFVTGALLENDVFTNVQTVNGHLVNDGDHTVVLGIALPDMQKSLALDSETLTLPEFVEIEADVKQFALPVTVTIATSEAFAALDADKLNDTETLKNAVAELTDGMNQLLDGGTQLYDGLTELADGTDQLAEGASALSDGLNTLIEHNESLVNGSARVFSTLLATANQQLAASGAEVPELTVENYAETLSTLIDSMSEEGIAQQARVQVEQAVRAQEEQVKAAVTQAVEAEMEAQVEAGIQAEVLSQVLSAVNMTEESYAAAKENGLLSAEQQTQIEGAVKQQMATAEIGAMKKQQLEAALASEDVQALIAQNTEQQVQALIDQNMNGEEVQQQIAQAMEQYQTASASLTALKEQLDSYNTFHTGLVAYTDGTASAADGAAQLSAAIPALQDGVTQLQSGALAMKDGLNTFYQDGVEKLNTLVNEDLEALLARARGLILAAQGAQNYSGIAENTDGAVRYLWRTDAIEP